MDTRLLQQATGKIVKRWYGEPTNLLQMLIALQQQFNHIPHDAIDQLADALALSPGDIRGVIGFYSFLHTRPRGDYDILFSDNITDRMLGSRKLALQLAATLEMEAGTTRNDLRVSLDCTSCTGMTDQGPAILVNGRAVTRLEPSRIEQMARLVEQGQPLDAWPAEWFRVDNSLQREDLVLGADYQPGRALGNTLKSDPSGIIQTLHQAGLRGCGGAGFSTARKWRFCAEAAADRRYVVCNADEGEPGTFKDRMLLQAHPDRMIEGMTLCARAIGAGEGFIYLRGEYRYLLESLEQCLQQRRDAQLLGKSILGVSGFDFDITIHLGAGAYVCGEESALIESLEGKRGIPRNRPPFPVTSGYQGHPTVVNNVETLANAAMILQHGSDWFRSVGSKNSPGTKLLSISGDCARPGLYEFPFGTPLHEILENCGATDTQAVQVGGAAGRLVTPDSFSRRIDFDDLSTGGSFMIFNRQRDLLQVIDNFSRFFRHESCGFCTPCRVGTSLLLKQLDKVKVGHATSKDLEELATLGNLMRKTSHCGLGQTAANPVLDGLAQLPSLFQSRLRSTTYEPAFDLDASLEEARSITGRSDPGAHLKGGGV
ncbi:MAG: NAD(P)H-dependent oxidoreductase subunit E [Sedimenticola sp.]|nr:NAD(P)H-dependent oxidoreductase subunit E [Sedimenticola sp.]